MERAGCSQGELALGGEAAAGSRRDQERLGLVLVCFVLVFCFFFFFLSLFNGRCWIMFACLN